MKAVGTKEKTAKEAAHDIVEQLNAGLLIDNDRAIVTEVDGQPAIALDVAFNAAMGFVDGTGVYGYEGWRPCGPYEGSCPFVHLEVHDSVTIVIYD